MIRPRAEPARPGYVFAYGSLAASPRGLGSVLLGYRRAWNVAMDNALSLAGYKYYVDPVSGERPDVAVTYLNLVPRPGGEVNGVLVAVDRTLLERLDARERNYLRCDVSAHVWPRPDRPVHAYLGTPAARGRFRSASARGRAVVSAEYMDAVIAGFAGLGARALERFNRSTQAPSCPRRALRRVDLPRAGLPG